LKFFFDWLLEIEGNAVVVIFAMGEGDLKTIISSPLSAIGSDSWTTSPNSGGKPHPRMFGTFPRVLGKYVREEKILTIETAIRKMTSFPAAIIGLSQKGIIKESFDADIVIFDQESIKDRATYNNPMQYPEGIKHVIVNGKLVVENGIINGNRAGKILRK